jgi:transposase
MPKHKSEDLKLLAVRHYLQNRNQIDTCELYDCSPRSLIRWVNKYQQTGEIKRNQRDSVSYKVTKNQVKFLLSEIKKDKTITIDNLLKKLKKKYPSTQLSRTHLGQVIKDNNISLKQTRVRHDPKTRYGRPVQIRNQLATFYQEIGRWNINDIICIDETSLNSFMVRHHCYEKVGKRCVIKTNDQEVFKKYTGIFAISANGMIDYEIYDKGGIDSDRLLVFLNKYITRRLRNKLIILDNASSHRNQRVKDLVNQHNKLLYSVPYQHYTNAIEQYFSVLKNKLHKKKGIGLTSLKRNVREVIRDINRETYRNIFRGNYDRRKEYEKRVSTRIRPLKQYKD